MSAREAPAQISAADPFGLAGSGPVELHRPGPVSDREAFLRRMPNAIFATERREAGPNLESLWFYWTGEEFWISTLTWTSKIKNLRRDHG